MSPYEKLTIPLIEISSLLDPRRHRSQGGRDHPQSDRPNQPGGLWSTSRRDFPGSCQSCFAVPCCRLEGGGLGDDTLRGVLYITSISFRRGMLGMRSRVIPTALHSVQRGLLGRIWVTACALLGLSFPRETTFIPPLISPTVIFSRLCLPNVSLHVTTCTTHVDHIYNYLLGDEEWLTASEERTRTLWIKFGATAGEATVKTTRENLRCCY